MREPGVPLTEWRCSIEGLLRACEGVARGDAEPASGGQRAVSEAPKSVGLLALGALEALLLLPLAKRLATAPTDSR